MPSEDFKAELPGHSFETLVRPLRGGKTTNFAGREGRPYFDLRYNAMIKIQVRLKLV